VTRDPRPPASANGDETKRRRRTGHRAFFEAELLETATQVFAKQGFAATNLQDIADAMGVTRTTLYHYGARKEDLLARIASDVITEAHVVERQLDTCKSLPPPDRLREMVRILVLQSVAHPARTKLMDHSEGDLPAEFAAVFHESWRGVFARLADLFALGAAQGSFELVDARHAAMFIIGSVKFAAWWFDPDVTSADVLASQFADMAVRSVLLSHPDDAHATGPLDAVARMRRDLDTLDRALRAPERAPSSEAPPQLDKHGEERRA
jgi:AcrR family transcriptional regulator